MPLYELIRDSNLPYVCFQGYEIDARAIAPTQTQPEFHILVPQEHLKTWIAYLRAEGADRTRETQRFTYLVPEPVSTGNSRSSRVIPKDKLPPEAKKNILHIYEKGRGIFPETFETEMLKYRVLHNSYLHIPEQTREFYMLLYINVVHRGLLDKYTRSVILATLNSRMGLARCTYHNFPTYLEPVVPGTEPPPPSRRRPAVATA